MITRKPTKSCKYEKLYFKQFIIKSIISYRFSLLSNLSLVSNLYPLFDMFYLNMDILCRFIREKMMLKRKCFIIFVEYHRVDSLFCYNFSFNFIKALIYQRILIFLLFKQRVKNINVLNVNLNCKIRVSLLTEQHLLRI